MAEISKIQVKRGLEAELIQLSEGEPALTTDTEKVFIGGTTDNIQLATQADIEAIQADIAAIPDASTTERGLVILEASVTSTSTTRAATSSSVKEVNDFAKEVQAEFRTFKAALTEGFTSNMFSDSFATLDAFNVTRGYYDEVNTRLVI